MIETSCAGCVFAKVKNKKQYGCALNRTQKLGTRKQETDGVEYDVCLRFCNTFRPDYWSDGLTLDEKLNADSIVMEEVRPRVGFLVYLDHSKSNPLTWLESTLMGIRDQTESHARYVIVINEKVEYNEQVHNMLIKFFDKEKTKVHLLQILEPPTNKIWIIDEAFRLALNGWLYVTTSGETVDRNLLKDLHQHLNVKMKKLSAVLPYEGINGLLLQTALFKFLNGNKTKVFDDKTKDSRLFLDKIKDMEGSENCILDWSQVNVA